MSEDSTERTVWFKQCRRPVIKLGSSLLTGPRGLNLVMVHRLTDQMAELREGNRQIVIVSSGAVSSGTRKIGLSERPRTIPCKQAAAAVGQSVLMQAWEEGFNKFDILVAQVLLTSEGLAQRHRYLNARNTLETLLDWGIVPVINENDTVVVEEIKFGDNDRLSAEIAGLVGADLVINLTDTEGLYDDDPRVNPSAKLISTVHRVDRKLMGCATPSPGTVGTGGMLSKLHGAKICMALGIPMVIAPGKERDVLLRLFEGENLGTFFVPRQAIYHGKKIWLSNLRRPAGKLIIDQGAVKALIKRGKSLLPIGIKGVQGNFGVGAAVQCLDESDQVIGMGLSNYRSTEIERIKGLHSDEIENAIGYKHSDEVIHRNNFVLAKEMLEWD